MLPYILHLHFVPSSSEPPSSLLPDSPLPPCVPSVLDANSDRFAPLQSLPPDRHIGHTIPLPPGHFPPYRASFRMSPRERGEVPKVVADLLAQGYIEPAKSPYGAPILFVQKKEGPFGQFLITIFSTH
jgi:hypothetical protein